MTIGDRFAEVLSAAREGADWAWTELYRDLSAELLRFLQASGAADAEDCLGETFICLVRSLPDFTGDEAGLRAWAFTVARSRLVDSFRRAQRRPRIAGGVELEELGLPAADQTALEQAAVADILEQLGPDQRAVIVLRVLHGFSVRQTAAILDRSEGAVKQLQHRAVAALRASIVVPVLPPETRGEVSVG